MNTVQLCTGAGWSSKTTQFLLNRPEPKAVTARVILPIKFAGLAVAATVECIAYCALGVISRLANLIPRYSPEPPLYPFCFHSMKLSSHNVLIAAIAVVSPNRARCMYRDSTIRKMDALIESMQEKFRLQLNEQGQVLQAQAREQGQDFRSQLFADAVDNLVQASTSECQQIGQKLFPEGEISCNFSLLEREIQEKQERLIAQLPRLALTGERHYEALLTRAEARVNELIRRLDTLCDTRFEEQAAQYGDKFDKNGFTWAAISIVQEAAPELKSAYFEFAESRDPEAHIEQFEEAVFAVHQRATMALSELDYPQKGWIAWALGR